MAIDQVKKEVPMLYLERGNGSAREKGVLKRDSVRGSISAFLSRRCIPAGMCSGTPPARYLLTFAHSLF